MYTGNQTSYENLSESMKQELEKLKTPIVNDLTTGGVDKAISAEAVKGLKNEVDEKANSEDLESLRNTTTEHLAELEQTTENHMNNQQIHVTEGHKSNWNYAFDATYNGRLAQTCVQTSDWNKCLINGWYMGSNTFNSPTGTPTEHWFMGEVIAHNNQYIVQRVIQFTDTSLPTYERSMNGGNWGAWTRVPDKQMYDKLVSNNVHWIDGTLLNGWSGTLKYTKNDIGIVTIAIDAVVGDTSTSIIANLPLDYGLSSLSSVIPILNFDTNKLEISHLIIDYMPNTGNFLRLPSTSLIRSNKVRGIISYQA
ncbi:pyocin knob domain-containing protein [Lysinibacillus sp. NPDC097231]|uniref:pyocin knob domain-containing protein n=1 Tax=Lysinibacillus sp. NPDC097231 TaxID=3364142 RepID=UPI00381C83DF